MREYTNLCYLDCREDIDCECCTNGGAAKEGRSRLFYGFQTCVLIGLFVIGVLLYNILNVAREMEIEADVNEIDMALRNPPVPLLRAHSHNDEMQLFPLRLAVSSGFCSIEADTILTDGALMTGHTFASEHTLEAQYVKPVALRANKTGGLFNPIGIRLNTCVQHILLIDMKTDPFEVGALVETNHCYKREASARLGMLLKNCSGNGIASSTSTSLNAIARMDQVIPNPDALRVGPKLLTFRIAITGSRVEKSLAKLAPIKVVISGVAVSN